MNVRILIVALVLLLGILIFIVSQEQPLVINAQVKNGGVLLSWNDVKADYYIIYRGILTLQPLANTTSTSFLDRPSNGNYTYGIQYVKEGKKSKIYTLHVQLAPTLRILEIFPTYSSSPVQLKVKTSVPAKCRIEGNISTSWFRENITLPIKNEGNYTFKVICQYEKSIAEKNFSLIVDNTAPKVFIENITLSNISFSVNETYLSKCLTYYNLSNEKVAVICIDKAGNLGYDIRNYTPPSLNLSYDGENLTILSKIGRLEKCRITRDIFYPFWDINWTPYSKVYPYQLYYGGSRTIFVECININGSSSGIVTLHLTKRSPPSTHFLITTFGKNKGVPVITLASVPYVAIGSTGTLIIEGKKIDVSGESIVMLSHPVCFGKYCIGKDGQKSINNTAVFLDTKPPYLKVHYSSDYLTLEEFDNSESLFGKIDYIYMKTENIIMGIKNDGKRRKLYLNKVLLFVCDEAGNCNKTYLTGDKNATYIITKNQNLELTPKGPAKCLVTLSSAYEERTWYQNKTAGILKIFLPNYDDIYGIKVKCGNTTTYYTVQLDREKPVFYSYLALPSGKKWILTWLFRDASGLTYVVKQGNNTVYQGRTPYVFVEPGIYSIEAIDEAGNQRVVNATVGNVSY